MKKYFVSYIYMSGEKKGVVDGYGNFFISYSDLLDVEDAKRVLAEQHGFDIKRILFTFFAEVAK